jgi:hypothetical protein
LYTRSRLVHAAASAGIDLLDVPFLNLDDPEGLRQEAMGCARLGFTGKASIHPNQIPIIHEAFTPTEAQIAKARKVCAAFEESYLRPDRERRRETFVPGLFATFEVGGGRTHPTMYVPVVVGTEQASGTLFGGATGDVHGQGHGRAGRAVAGGGGGGGGGSRKGGNAIDDERHGWIRRCSGGGGSGAGVRSQRQQQTPPGGHRG